MGEKIYWYPLWIRIWHGFNAILCILLILTGISMQYSNPDTPFIHFNVAVSIHNISGIVLTASYLLFFIGNIISKNRKNYALVYKGLWTRIRKQFRYYAYGIFKGEKSPYPVNSERKFNPLQKVSYAIVMYVALPILFITGWAFLFPEFILTKFLGFSGFFSTAQLHMTMGFFVSIFLIIHLYVSSIGKTPGSNYMSIITGWQEEH